MFKTPIALILLSSLAIAAPAQRGSCDQYKDCRQATPTESPKAQEAPRSDECKSKASKGKQRGQASTAKKECCGQVGPSKKKIKGQKKGKGLGKKRSAAKSNCADINCGPGKKGKMASKATKGFGPCGGATGFGKQANAANGEAKPFKLPDGVTAEVAKQWVAKLQPILEAELYAQEYYEAASKAFTGVRKFKNLARAEGNHARAISNAIQMMGGTPGMKQPKAIVIPRTIAAADKHCEEVELHVIDIYKGMIKTAPTPQLKGMFENIQRANMRHLNAVQ